MQDWSTSVFAVATGCQCLEQEGVMEYQGDVEREGFDQYWDEMMKLDTDDDRFIWGGDNNGEE